GSRRTYFAAVRFANRCLPFRNIKARWINILAIAGIQEESSRDLTEEGKKGLDPWWFRTLNSEQPWLWRKSDSEDDIHFPDFTALTNAIYRPEDEDPDEPMEIPD